MFALGSQYRGHCLVSIVLRATQIRHIHMVPWDFYHKYYTVSLCFRQKLRSRFAPSAVCSTTARWRDQARPQRRKAAGARFAPSAVCFTAARWRDQPRPHRRRTAGARFVSQCCLPRPHRRRTAGARFASQCCLPGPHRRRTAGASFASQRRHRGRTGVEQTVLGLSPSAVCRGRTGVEQPVLALPPSAVCSTPARHSTISRGPGLSPAPSVLRRRWAEQSAEGAPA